MAESGWDHRHKDCTGSVSKAFIVGWGEQGRQSVIKLKPKSALIEMKEAWGA